MTSRSRLSLRHASGFSLIEVLVGTAILGLTMTLLSSALYGVSRSARAGEARLEDVDSSRLAYAFLRRQLGEAFPLTDGRGDALRVLFDGGRDGVRFIGHLPAHRGGGGLQMIELRAEPDRGGLVIYYRNAWPDTPFDAPLGSDWEKQAVLPGVARVEYRYFGSSDDETPAAWTDVWSDADRLPALIRMDLELATGKRSAPLTVTVRTRAATGQNQLHRSLGEHSP